MNVICIIHKNLKYICISSKYFFVLFCFFFLFELDSLSFNIPFIATEIMHYHF